jgi:hypothetical protein
MAGSAGSHVRSIPGKGMNQIKPQREQTCFTLSLQFGIYLDLSLILENVLQEQSSLHLAHHSDPERKAGYCWDRCHAELGAPLSGREEKECSVWTCHQ